jgi:hypothetical protein
VIPVIIGPTGMISESFSKCLSNIPGNHKIKELQKTAVLLMAHILQKALCKGTTDVTLQIALYAL